jgi:ATP-dependent helicase/nuclease subunit B
MSLRIVFGRAGSGKTSWCFDSLKQSKGSLILLVPESMSHETEIRAGYEFGYISSIGTDVITFERLAYRVFNELGGAKGRYITAATKNIILSQILKNRRQELSFFSGIVGKPGFIKVVADLISEMKKNLVTPEMLNDYIDETIATELKKKLNDISIIYSDYNNYLENTYLDSSDNITVLSKKIK